MSAGCLEEHTVLAFLGGTLPQEARSSVEGHIAACSACADLVTWAAAVDAASATGSPGETGRPFVGHLQPGARVGRYQVLGALGRGGMGEVYAAYHPDLDRRIALKVVQGLAADSTERRVRLLREARAIARLSHPNVITVHDAGTFGDRVFIAMELIDGLTIEQWLRAEPRTWQAILDVFIAAGRGLAAAHAAGVIHRDFKPQNVMIGKDGGVRVMDFGLARVAGEGSAEGRDAGESDPPIPCGLITKTGAFIGTPAYMSPEQFRREATDARSDQFSFCIALHDALFGTRPGTANAEVHSPPTPSESDEARPRPTNVPSWLRQIVLRGTAPDREQRYSSMHALLTALERARSRTSRRTVAIASATTVLLLSIGGWRLAHGNRFVCAVPADRVAAAWSPGNPTDPRHRAIHGAFAASGRATAETSWQRFSKVLDEYVTAWSAMYLQTCEATHVRGEQSAEILDLRMSCLNDNLDQVRALGDALVSADGTALSRAVTAAQGLTPVSRCADVALLKSAVPLPKDERTLRDVLRLRQAIRVVRTKEDLGNFKAVLTQAQNLRPEVEATGYRPLLADLLSLLGNAEVSIYDDASKSEATLREAMIEAEAGHDDVTAARVAANLVYIVGYRFGRIPEAKFWADLGHAILDRIGGDQARVRSWLVGNLGGAHVRSGDFEGALALLEKAVALKTHALGAEHPDVAVSHSDLAYVLTRLERPAEALAAADRAIAILVEHSDPNAYVLAYTYSNQGEALSALGRYIDAESAFKNALRLLAQNVGPRHPENAFALHGLGEIKLAQRAPRAAIGLFEEALRIRRHPDEDPALEADSEFGLARALWASGSDRTRARALAAAALKTYRDGRRPEHRRAVEAWLVEHR